jgi:thiol reductant ABC exporter CydD subunit
VFHRLHRSLIALAGEIRRPLAVSVCVGLGVFGLLVLQAVIVGHVLGQIASGASFGEVSDWLWLVVGVVLVRAVLLWCRELVAMWTAAVVKVRLRDRLFSQLVTLGPGFLTAQRSGKVQSTLVDGVEGLEAYYSRYLPQLLVVAVGPPLVLVWIATQDVVIAGVVFLAMLSIPTLPRLVDRVLVSRGRDHWDAYTELSAEYLDAMQGMTTLKAANASTHRRSALIDKGQHLFRSTMRQMAVSLVDSGVTELGVQIGTAVAVGVGAFRVANGDLDVDTLVIMLVLVGVVFRPFRELSAAWHAGFLGVSAASGIAELLHATPPSPDGAAPVELPQTAVGVVFEDVSFTYPERSTPALRNVSFTVEPGETVAIVGRSGAGKTTLVSLLLRFASPTSGAIRVGGVDIATASAESVRRLVAVVSQDSYLFTGTIAENLRLARPDATDEDLVAAAKAAGIHAHVSSLPEGYATRVGERGLTLSGGQRQRVAIARALLKDAPILVLDEATSAIDAEQEATITEELDRLRAGRATLVIAHRLNTVRSADRIVVLADGAIVEAGRHDELVASQGTYADLVAAQEVRA